MMKRINIEELQTIRHNSPDDWIAIKESVQAQLNADKQEVRELFEKIERLWKPQHYKSCYGVIVPHPNCICCKWQALKRETLGGG